MLDYRGATRGRGWLPTGGAAGSRLFPLAVAPFLVLLFVIALCPLPSYAQVAPPSLADYEGWLREAFVAAQRGDRLGLEQVAPRLVEARAVTLPDGTSAPVDNAWLRAALEAPDPDLPTIAERLGALVDALAAPGSAAPADARERLRRILAAPPFARPEPAQSSWLGDLLDWLFRLLARLLEPAFRAGAGSSSLVGWLAFGIGLVALAGILAYVIVKVRRGTASDARARADHDPEANLTAAAARQQAASLASGGDYRTAVRFMYLAALLRLDERGLLRYDRALTNREYLDRLGDNVALRAQLALVVETFDRVWYGYAPLDAGGFEQYRRTVEAVG
jgi:hypothetical protein